MLKKLVAGRASIAVYADLRKHRTMWWSWTWGFSTSILPVLWPSDSVSSSLSDLLVNQVLSHIHFLSLLLLLILPPPTPLPISIHMPTLILSLSLSLFYPYPFSISISLLFIPSSSERSTKTNPAYFYIRTSSLSSHNCFLTWFKFAKGKSDWPSSSFCTNTYPLNWHPLGKVSSYNSIICGIRVRRES